MQVLSVAELGRFLRGLIEAEPTLGDLAVRGEVGNCKLHPSGHLYFSLRDATAQVHCVMFRSRARTLTFTPKDGDMVLVHGQVSFYETAGRLQLYAQAMEPMGVGAELLRLQELKRRLEAEGLFESGRKRPLPLLPARVGVVTSASGAALRDIIQVSRRRHPRIDLVVAPAKVQGVGAAQEIVAAIRLLNRRGRVDVIIVGRGGGAQEDLSAFNEESVVRAVAASRTPVVSAVGHETDFTLVDFAADRRAPTPSAAAEIVVPPYFELMGRVQEMQRRAEGALRRRVSIERRRLQQLASRPPLRRPREVMLRRRARLAGLEQMLAHLGAQPARSGRARLERLQAQLQGLSPLGPVARGYALVLREGQVVRRAADLAVGEALRLRLQDGQVQAEVLAVEPGEGEVEHVI